MLRSIARNINRSRINPIYKPSILLSRSLNTNNKNNSFFNKYDGKKIIDVPITKTYKTEFVNEEPIITEQKFRQKVVIKNEPQINSMKDVGLQKFMIRVYGTTSVGIFVALTSSVVAMPIALTNPFITMGVGVVGMFGSLYAFHKSEYKTFRKLDETNKNNIILYTENSVPRTVSFATLCVSSGLLISPIIEFATFLDPSIFPIAAGLTLTTMAGSSLVAYYRPAESTLTWGAPLMTGLCGLIGMGIINISSLMIFGPSFMSDMFHTIDLYAGILIFSGITAYDTQLAIKKYKLNDPDHLECAVGMFLNFINLMIRFVEILTKIKKN